MSETTPPPEAEVACANCGRRFVGTWCPDCGQEDADLERPLRRFLHDLLSDAFAFDARIWRTIPPLLTNPGVLSREYVRGHRVRYVPPLRLYVFVSAVFFGVLALTGGGPFRFGVVPGSGGATIGSAAGIEFGVSESDLSGRDAVGFAAAFRDLERLNDVVIATLSYVHVLLLPALAAYLAVLWRKRWFLEHLVFAVHLGAFSLIVGSVVVVVYALAGNPDPPIAGAEAAMNAWGLLLLVMSYRAVRTMYGNGRVRSLVKATVLTFAYLLTAAFSVFAILITTLVVFY